MDLIGQFAVRLFGFLCGQNRLALKPVVGL